MNNYKQYKFEDLGCWKKARLFRKEVFNIAIHFPQNGYKLKHQIIGAAGSIGHNIAEGFGRGNFKENIQFCRIARASAIEVRDQLYTARLSNLQTFFIMVEFIVKYAPDASVGYELVATPAGTRGYIHVRSVDADTIAGSMDNGIRFGVHGCYTMPVHNITPDIRAVRQPMDTPVISR